MLVHDVYIGYRYRYNIFSIDTHSYQIFAANSPTSDNSYRSINAAVLILRFICFCYSPVAENGDTGPPLDGIQTAQGGVVGVRCASHTIQLSVKGLLQRGGAAACLLGRVRGVVVKTHTQNIRLVFTKNKKPLPVLDVETRWSSAYSMLESMLGIREFIDELALTNDALAVSPEDWAECEELLAALKPLHMLTKTTQVKKSDSRRVPDRVAGLPR